MPTTRIDPHERVLSVDQDTLTELVEVIYARCLKLAMDVRQPEELSMLIAMVEAVRVLAVKVKSFDAEVDGMVTHWGKGCSH